MRSWVVFDRKHQLFALLALRVLVVTLVSFAAKASGRYHVTNKFVVGGGGGSDSWDYLTIDPASRHLYLTHTTKVDVIDADTGRSIGEIADTPGVHGVAIVSDLGKGFASDAKADR